MNGTSRGLILLLQVTRPPEGLAEALRLGDLACSESWDPDGLVALAKPRFRWQ